jgi:DNA invertase Pin-like site-specific DNA recombinase
MAKGKILVFLRVSTEAQELDTQRNEMRDFVKSMGYTDVIYVEGKGAAAIKINDEYISMYEEVKSYIDRKEISAVAVWHVNRLARDEEWFVKFKKLFIENKIQFIIKNPTLCLLNEDGSVNAGSELALSLFSTMSSQDMEEKKAKFKRAKAERARKGMYNGGTNKKFGYKVVNKYFVEDETEGAIVKLIFQLYSTGEYSTYSLANELNSRG